MVGDLYTKEVKEGVFGIFRTGYPKDKKIFVGTRNECIDFKTKMYDKVLARMTKTNKKNDYGKIRNNQQNEQGFQDS